MNIFILSLIQKEIAEFMMDKHVSKILLEAVQMLCSAKRVLEPDADADADDAGLYKMAHKNHPVTIWCRKSRANFVWVLDLVDELHKEWKYRYGHPESKMHKSYLVALYLREHIPSFEKFEEEGVTEFALAMPEQYKLVGDPIMSYRNYYMSEEKQRIASWKKKRDKPAWYVMTAAAEENKKITKKITKITKITKKITKITKIKKISKITKITKI